MIEPRADPVVGATDEAGVPAVRAGRIRNAPQADAPRRSIDLERLDAEARRRRCSPARQIDPGRSARRRCRPRISRRLRGERRSVAVRQREAEPLELHRHVDRLDRHVGRRVKLRRREVQNRLHPGLHDAVDDASAPRRRAPSARRCPDARAGCRARAARCREPRLPSSLRPIFSGLLSYAARMREAALTEATILGERRADLPGADDDDAPLASRGRGSRAAVRRARARSSRARACRRTRRRRGPFAPGPTSFRRGSPALHSIWSAARGVSKSSRNRRYAERRRTVESAMRFTEMRAACEFIHKLKERVWLHQRLRQR